MEVIKFRHVEARLARQPQEQVVARFRFVHHAEQGRDENFTFADADDVNELGDRLRIEKGRRAAHHHKRMPFVAVGGAHRQLCQAQQLGDVEIVGFKRHGDGQHIEVGNRS